MNDTILASIHQKSLQTCGTNNGVGGIYRETTEIGEIEAYSVSTKKPFGGHSYRTSWMLDGKRIAYSKLAAMFRA